MRRTKQDPTTVFNAVWNPANREITDDEIRGILSYFGVPMQPYNLDLYRRAFVHDSYSYVQYPELTGPEYPGKEPAPPRRLYSKHNQRLEILGDGVIELIAKYYIYVRWPHQDEGFITDIKIEMVKNETLGKLATDMGLPQWYMMSRPEEQKGLRQNLVRLGCLFEAFVGAIFLDFNRMDASNQPGWSGGADPGSLVDGNTHPMPMPFLTGPGFQVAQLFVTRVFDSLINWTAVLTGSENFKRPLQELLQCEFKVTPTFDYGPSHVDSSAAYPSVSFHMCVFLCIGTTPPRTTYANAAAAKRAATAVSPLVQQSVPLSQFSSFAAIHQWLAETGGHAIILLGTGHHRKKQGAEQDACRAAIQAIKGLADFEQVYARTRQKYAAMKMS